MGEMPNESNSAKSLLDKLIDLRWPVSASENEIEIIPDRLTVKQPTFSYKTRKVTVSIELVGFPLTYVVPIKKLDRAIDDVCKLADVIDLGQALLCGLLWSQHLYAPQSEGRGKPRGKRAKSKAFISKLKYAAAWTYEFVKQELQKPSTDRYVLLQRAQEKLKEERDGRECHDDVEVTAFLVFHALKAEWKKYRIQNPWEKEFSSENFLRRYIKPVATRIEMQIQRKPMLLTPLPINPVVFQQEDETQETWVTACQDGRFRNPILREVFKPWTSC